MQITKAYPGCLAVLLLAACSPGAGPPLADYLERLGRSLDRDIVQESTESLALPARRDMSKSLPGESIDLLDLLSLGGCELSVTIGKRNSSLGKLATASQRLLLELEFMAQAPACIDSLDQAGDAELANTLRTALGAKRRQLPARIWDATLGGPEFRDFWKRPRALGDYPASTGARVPTAITRLDQLAAEWLAGNYLAGHRELEPLLAVVRRGDGGALLLAFTRQRSGLAAADRAIESRGANAPLCFEKRPSPQGRILENVVRDFFAGRVQPWSVKLERRRLQLMPALRALEQRLAAAIPDPYRDWLERRDAMLTDAVAAPRRHATALADLLETCGLRPGQAAPAG